MGISWSEECRDSDGAYWRIRWNDPVLKKPDGSPRPRAQTPKPKPRSKRACDLLCLEFDKQLPPDVPKGAPGVRPVDRQTVAQLAAMWHTSNPRNRERDDARDLAIWAAGEMRVEFPAQLTAKVIGGWRDRREAGTDLPLAYLRSILNWSVAEGHLHGADLDLGASKAMARPPTAEWDGPTMTVAQYEAQEKVAAQWGPNILAMFRFATLYGQRPSTICRLKVRNILDDGTFRAEPGIQKNSPRRKPTRPQVFTLLPDSAAELAAITAGRDPEAPLFTSPRGLPWRMQGHSAIALSLFYDRHFRELAQPCGALLAWKRFAIWRMDKGRAPWPYVLKHKQMMLYTGHRTIVQLMRYLGTSEQETEDIAAAARAQKVVAAPASGA